MINQDIQIRKYQVEDELCFFFKFRKNSSPKNSNLKEKNSSKIQKELKNQQLTYFTANHLLLFSSYFHPWFPWKPLMFRLCSPSQMGPIEIQRSFYDPQACGSLSYRLERSKNVFQKIGGKQGIRGKIGENSTKRKPNKYLLVKDY